MNLRSFRVFAARKPQKLSWPKNQGMTEMKEEISLRNYQEMVDEWIRTVGVRYFSELSNLAQLVEEVGEVARIMSRTYGDQSFKSSEAKQDLADELADVFFVLTCIANQTGVDLTKAVRKNFEKKSQRDEKRHRDNPKLRPESNPKPEPKRGNFDFDIA